MGLYQGDNLLSSIGKSPAAYAKDNGYTGTDDEFYSALADMPGHLDNKENPHGVTAAQVGADASGAAATALANAKSYTDQEVANATPGTATKDSPTGADSLFLYDAADSNKPKKTLISKLVELFNNTFYTKTETNTLLQNKAEANHTHDDRYYTEAEVNNLMAGKQDASTAINTGNIDSQSVNYANSANYANGAGNADTVDGWHMNLDPGSWGIKPICAGTGDMSAGSTALADGHIYLVYE